MSWQSHFQLSYHYFFVNNVISHEPFVRETTRCAFYVQNPPQNCNFKSDGNQVGHKYSYRDIFMNFTVVMFNISFFFILSKHRVKIIILYIISITVSTVNHCNSILH